MNPPFAVVPIAASQQAGSQLELLYTPQSCRETEVSVRRNLPEEPQTAGGWVTNDRNKRKKKWKKLLFHREDGGVGRLMCVSQPPSPAVYKAPGSVSVCVSLFLSVSRCVLIYVLNCSFQNMTTGWKCSNQYTHTGHTNTQLPLKPAKKSHNQT